MKNTKRCYGRFCVSYKIIRDNPNMVLLLMKDILVTRAESMYNDEVINYIGISEKYFNDVKLGDKIPKYRFVISENKVNPMPRYNVQCETIEE